ncbi:MAG: 4'-phosphopantetheinyl transferase superfamily protein [Desulfobacterales bacterium]|nr:4'-phosphopantetheinyl transferase superfamily protein [Desulfobacterales bacterium]
MDKLNPTTQTLYPVILPVPVEVLDYTPRERVIFLSRHARVALRQSAQISGVELGELEKDEDGVPLPKGGQYWSISHKTHYVCGVVAPQPIGIDIERIREFSEGVFKKTASEDEWSLADMKTNSLMSFFRFWTAKEAVLKATGIGIRDLLRCRVYHIIDDTHLKIQYGGKDWLIEHFFYDDHVASIVKGSYRIDWSVNS